MAKGKNRDNISRKYMSDPQRFAQICNNALFDGENIIHAEGLSELDAYEAKVIGVRKEDVKVFWKNRDILKMYQDQCVLAILGIENQSDIHYCMPLRGLLYDALNYEEQREQIKKEHDRKKDLRGPEFVSGFSKTDRLLPVFTIVIYYGAEEWDGARSLQELFDFPEALEPYKDRLLDYHINLVDINRMDNLEQYEGELKAFLGFLKYQANARELNQFIEANRKMFEELPRETVEAIAIMGNMRDVEEYLHQDNEMTGDGKERINMCQAWEEIKADCRSEGRSEGRKEGINEGIRAFIWASRDEGAPEECIINKVQKYFSLTEEESRKLVNASCQGISHA